MSISHRSGPVDRLCALVAAAGLLTAGLLTAGPCLADASDESAAPLSRAESAALSRAAQVVIKSQDDLPNDSEASIAWAVPLRRELPGGSGQLAAVGVVRFAGLANRYCRVFIAAGDLTRATLVPVPAAANYDHCLQAGPLHAVDIDGDGIVDLVHTVAMKSNRYPTTVSETVVYLGRRDAASGFCYSADASRELAAADVRTSTSLVSAASRALERTAKTGFTCAAH